MAEKLTKTAIKNELTRRIDWFEKAYEFDNESTMLDCTSQHQAVALGRYRTLTEIRYQIENGFFINGFAC